MDKSELEKITGDLVLLTSEVRQIQKSDRAQTALLRTQQRWLQIFAIVALGATLLSKYEFSEESRGTLERLLIGVTATAMAGMVGVNSLSVPQARDTDLSDIESRS